MIQELLRKTKLKELMAAPAITVNQSDDFHVVQDKFTTHNIRHLPVLDDSGGVIGLITQRQLYKIHSPRKLEDGTWYYDKDMLDGFILKNVMIKEVVLLKPENTLSEALKIVSQSKLGCIPIVDDYRLPLGIVTRSDIFKFFLNHA
jgi:CBS domain-containing protein